MSAQPKPVVFNPSIAAEVIYLREASERRNAAARRECLSQGINQNRGLVLAALLWYVPECDWGKVER
jgi:hypothetical protein